MNVLNLEDRIAYCFNVIPKHFLRIVLTVNPFKISFKNSTDLKQMCTSKYTLVHSGCCNKIPQTVQLTKKHRYLHLTVPEAGSLRSECQQVRGGLSFALQTSSCILTWCKGQGVLLGLLYKDTNPIHEGSTLTTNHLPKASFPNTIALSITLGFQHTKFGDDKHSDNRQPKRHSEKQEQVSLCFSLKVK